MGYLNVVSLAARRSRLSANNRQSPGAKGSLKKFEGRSWKFEVDSEPCSVEPLDSTLPEKDARN